MQRQYPHTPSRPIYTMGGYSTAQLMYNIGVSQLFAKNPVQAFDFLLQAVQVFHLNPRLWLRMAECCIMTHKEVSIVKSKIVIYHLERRCGILLII